MTIPPTRIPEGADDTERMAAFSRVDGRLLHPPANAATLVPSPGPTRRAIFVDVETTGLDAAKDSVIELAVLPFDYTADGTIVAVDEPFSSLRDPGFPISAEITYRHHQRQGARRKHRPGRGDRFRRPSRSGRFAQRRLRPAVLRTGMASFHDEGPGMFAP
jgi:hypothetical protein